MENFNDHIINKCNLKSNYNQIKNYVGNKVKVCAMVKADAYGHGIKDVCKALSNADFFGVASAMEAKNIRKFNKRTPILIVGVVNPESIVWCSKNNVSVTITSLEELKKFSLILGYNKLKCHLKINTGLNRIGFDNVNQFRKALKFIKHNSNICLEGVFTHFATKLSDVEFIVRQHQRFMQFVNFVDDSVIVHCCNSFATLMLKDYHHSMVRCGFNLYGWQLDYKMHLKPVLSILSRVVFIHNIKAGETVGYDRTFTATKNTKIAVLPIGYADGFDRRLSNKGYVIINGKKAYVVGNICMDVCLVDVTKIKDVRVGSIATLIGRNGGAELTPYHYANWLGTSPYEILLKFKHERMNKIVLKDE